MVVYRIRFGCNARILPIGEDGTERSTRANRRIAILSAQLPPTWYGGRKGGKKRIAKSKLIYEKKLFFKVYVDGDSAIRWGEIGIFQYHLLNHTTHIP